MDDGVPVCDEVRVPELLGVPVIERVPVADNEHVPDEELVDADVLELVPVMLLVAACDDVTLLVPAGEGDDERLRKVAMLRPRKVIEDTAASASPTSHSVDRSTPLATREEGTSCVTLR